MDSKNNWYNKDINRNFFFLNAHGDEIERIWEVPKGVRIIMFCYSKELQVCDRFDRYNWSHILLDPSASDNYCDFLKNISGYSSIKDHFCIYEEHDRIRDIDIETDEKFREGMYRLPVKGYVYDKNNDSIIVSDGTLMSEIHKHSELNKIMNGSKPKKIVVDSKKIVDLLRVNNKVGIIQSHVRKIHDKARLSNLINSMKLHMSGLTILLMVCRNRDEYARSKTGGEFDDISPGRVVSDELKRMKGKCNLEKLIRM
jgi:hypothetical protein